MIQKPEKQKFFGFFDFKNKARNVNENARNNVEI